MAEYAGDADHQSHGYGEFVDLDDELLDQSFIGRKWLVVVDYHR